MGTNQFVGTKKHAPNENSGRYNIRSSSSRKDTKAKRKEASTCTENEGREETRVEGTTQKITDVYFGLGRKPRPGGKQKKTDNDDVNMKTFPSQVQNGDSWNQVSLLIPNAFNKELLLECIDIKYFGNSDFK
ncbi:hypothetical protein RJT34_23875 [Clitoria ternatea]|uniref:Uncharacterized protein n=1 Tax=Clitoria ternatea TaxID=43366 RepID=A0AAN9FLT9_CLITE